MVSFGGGRLESAAGAFRIEAGEDPAAMRVEHHRHLVAATPGNGEAGPPEL